MMRIAPLLLVALPLGCTSSAVPPPKPTPPPAEKPFNASWESVAAEVHGKAWVHPERMPVGKVTRRLTVDQLRRSIPSLFAGIQWTDDQGRDMFNLLAGTLGEADFVERTEHDQSTSPLFAKFMDDMAGQVCTKAVQQDSQQANADDRVLVRVVGDIEANLRYLRRKLHSLHVPDRQPDPSISAYRRLYDDIAAEGSAEQAWVGVCVAMLTAPEFMAY
jgi:hypothetical protein